MHICFLAWDFPDKNESTGGIGVFVKGLARALILRGHQVSVISQSKKNTAYKHVDEGIEVWRIIVGKTPFLGTLQNAFRISAALKKIDKKSAIDIVETSETQGAFIPKLTHAKHIVRLHGGHLFFANAENRKSRAFRKWIEHRTLLQANGIVSVSDYVFKETMRLHNLNLDAKIIRNAITIVDQKHYTHAFEQTFLFVGWIVPKKGILNLLEAFFMLADEFPTANLVLAGRSGVNAENDKFWQEEYEAMIPPKLKQRITFLGALPNDLIPVLMQKSRVIVLPSLMEALPMAWLEALASGRPLIATNILPALEIIENGVNGLLVPPNDSKALNEKMRWSLLNEEKANAIGLKGRLKIEREFSMQKAVLENENFYSNLITST